MSEAFLKVVNMSISAGWLVLAVLVLRLILKKTPKWVNVLLWGIVAVRLICPFSIESALSLIPSTETISPEIMMDWTPEISTGIAPLDQAVNPVISASFAPNPGASANPLQILIPVAANLWLLGVLILLAYTSISYLTLRHKLRTAVILRGNIFQCETVSSPFVLGILKPRIYLPYSMDGQNLHHVVAHEQAHIRRKDHWWKPLGFLLLTVYWFNPLMWIAYIMLCRDIELACDEKVIAELGNEQRADYTQALVACSVNRRMIAACPLAFGEVGVKERVKSIMNYRKPTFWIIVTAVVVCMVVAVCFLTDPNPSREFSMNGMNVSGLDPEAIVERILDIEDWESSNVYMNSNNFSLMVDSNFNWVDSQAVRYFFGNARTTYTAQLRIFPDEGKYFLTEPSEWMEQNRIFLLQYYLEAIKYLPQNVIRQMAPADQYIIQHIDGGRPSDFERVITYSSDGVGETDGWYLHLRVQPLHADGEGFSGSGEEVVDLFYGASDGETSSQAIKWFDYLESPDEMIWDGLREINLPEFPGVTFRWYSEKVEAVTEKEITPLYSGMPVWSVYFCDLTGDGLPEICSQVSMGSGIIDNHVIIFDYANDVSYKLEDRGYHDYYLRMNKSDGYLYVDKKIYNSEKLVSSGRLIFKDGCIQIDGVYSEPMNVLKAKVLEIHGGYFLVEPVEGSWELSSADKIEIPMKNMSPSPEPQVGDILEIEYDGRIQETYPAKITEVYSIRIAQIDTVNPSETESTYEIYNVAPLEDLPDTYSLEEATIDKCVIHVDGDVRDNVDVWEAFVDLANSGEQASVRVAKYYHGSDTEPSRMHIFEITFDGKSYQIRWFEDGKEYVRTYQYLRYFAGAAETEGAKYDAYVSYILTDNTKATRHQLFLSYASSALNAAIPHFEVYTDYIYYPDHPEIPSELLKAELITWNEQAEKVLRAEYTEEKVLNSLQKLLANAEALGYEPKTYGICCNLTLTGADGNTVELGLDAESDYFVLNGVFFDYGPGYDADGCLDATDELLSLLGLKDWP